MTPPEIFEKFESEIAEVSNDKSMSPAVAIAKLMTAAVRMRYDLEMLRNKQK